MALTEIDTDIWLAEGACVSFYGLAYPTRMVIVRLPDQTLWIWSPIHLSEELSAQIEDLGAVAHLVSPNKFHYLFLQEWAERWPQAKLWGPKSTIEKCSHQNFETPLMEVPPAAWQGVLDTAWIRGSFMLDEIVFFHLPSRTTIIADLSQNFSEAFLKDHWPWWQRPIAKLWKIVEGYGYAPLEWRITFLRKTPTRRARAKILSWDSAKVVMAHGTWQSANGQAYLERAMTWLKRK